MITDGMRTNWERERWESMTPDQREEETAYFLKAESDRAYQRHWASRLMQTFVALAAGIDPVLIALAADIDPTPIRLVSCFRIVHAASQ